MNETGQDARDIFPAGSDDLLPQTALPGGVPGHGIVARRGRGPRMMRALVSAGAMAAVAAAGAAVGLLARSGSAPPSPLAAVTGALAKTSAASYSFSMDSTVRFAGREMHSDLVTGSIDPRRGHGTELLTSTLAAQSTVTAKIRFVSKYVYTWVSPGPGRETLAKPWDKAPVPETGTRANGAYGFSTAQPVSPAGLLAVLRSAATVRDEGRASASGWTGTKYAFTARLSAAESISGTIYVDKQGQVRRLVMTDTEGLKHRLTQDRDLTFGDFGAPVPVTAPPASQVEYTSKPYWGFYF